MALGIVFYLYEYTVTYDSYIYPLELTTIALFVLQLRLYGYRYLWLLLCSGYDLQLDTRGQRTFPSRNDSASEGEPDDESDSNDDQKQDLSAMLILEKTTKVRT